MSGSMQKVLLTGMINITLTDNGVCYSKEQLIDIERNEGRGYDKGLVTLFALANAAGGKFQMNQLMNKWVQTSLTIPVANCETKVRSVLILERL